MQGKKRNRRRRHNPAERLSSSVGILGYTEDLLPTHPHSRLAPCSTTDGKESRSASGRNEGDAHHRLSSDQDLSNDHDTPTLPSGTRKRPRVEQDLEREEPLSVNNEPSSRFDNDF